VIIDEPGNHGLASQIDALRVRSRKPGDVLNRTDGNDAVPTDRDRLSDREAIIAVMIFPLVRIMSGLACCAYSGIEIPPSAPTRTIQASCLIAFLQKKKPFVAGSVLL